MYDFAPEGRLRVQLQPAGRQAPDLPRPPRREITLTREAIAWMAALPANVRPAELAVRFPHVLNRLAAVWAKHDRCCACFDSLVHDRRGGRRGFPPRAAMELAALKRHYDSAARRALQDCWNDILVR